MALAEPCGRVARLPGGRDALRYADLTGRSGFARHARIMLAVRAGPGRSAAQGRPGQGGARARYRGDFTTTPPHAMLVCPAFWSWPARYCSVGALCTFQDWRPHIVRALTRAARVPSFGFPPRLRRSCHPPLPPCLHLRPAIKPDSAPLNAANLCPPTFPSYLSYFNLATWSYLESPPASVIPQNFPACRPLTTAKQHSKAKLPRILPTLSLDLAPF